MRAYKKVTSLDGTTISYAMDGQGLGIIIIPGVVADEIGSFFS